MINNTEFAKRLKKIMDYHQISASVFADKIKVQRSSISHLLSGRNKPSLDFVLKVIKEFEEVELYWLLNGKGNFPQNKNFLESSTSIQKVDLEETRKETIPVKDILNNPITSTSSTGKSIERIVLFYTDGTFKEYKN